MHNAVPALVRVSKNLSFRIFASNYCVVVRIIGENRTIGRIISLRNQTGFPAVSIHDGWADGKPPAFDSFDET